jgi:membrane carboxypeptidase/penicillin-binding protein
MSTILVKIFATALVLSQVTTRPDAVKPEFDPVGDQPQVAQLLRDGCGHFRKAFDIEDINLDDLIATAMDDPQALTAEIKVLRGLSFGDLLAAYRQFCKNETVTPAVDLAEVIGFYNKAMADLPDHTSLKDRKLPGTTLVLDAQGKRFAELFEPEHRRIWVPLAEIPEHVQKAFVAAEDKRFFQHKGIDERGLIRAFMGNLTQPGRPQGGSTITQQVAKNLLVGADVTYERKMREIVIAARMERTLTKGDILELYLNSIYLGRGSWGIEMAARSYFGKSANALTLAEGALLAGLTKGPNYFNPDRQPDRARERLAYVLNRMKEDGAIAAGEVEPARVLPVLAAYERERRNSGFHALAHFAREAKTVAGIEALTASSYTVRSTVYPELQRSAEAALQEGLARYELNTGRLRFEGAEANLSEAIQRITAENKGATEPAWQVALRNARLPLYDVHWAPAIVVEKARQKGGEVVRVGLNDGRVLALQAWNAVIRKKLNLHDVVYVRVTEPKGRTPARADLRVRPSVQGAALVLENKTGRILAMAGGFSFPLSQLNRATQAQRQPGSAIKPLVYLAALRRGLQPNTLVYDTPITLPPIERGYRPGADARDIYGRGSYGRGGYEREQDYWSPKNYDHGSAGVVTLRRALENSKNLVTVRLLEGGIEPEPEASLDRICELAQEAQIYKECVRYYPFVLGAQPVRLIDLAAFYAAIANEGVRPTPFAIATIEQSGRTIYQHPPASSVWVGSADRVAFYQLKTMLQGVLQRGTARQIRHLAPFVAGKTGTTDNENDAWFVGFTNDVTVAVWVGYDNADGKRRTLGSGQTGAKVALPIFEQVIQAAWTHHAPKVALAPPSPEAQRSLVALPIDLATGDRVAGGQGAYMEQFRRDRFGRLQDTQFHLVPQEQAYAYRNYPGVGDGETAGAWWGEYGNRPFAGYPYWRDPSPGIPQDSPLRGLFGEPRWDERRARPRRVDPDYFWGNRLFN